MKVTSKAPFFFGWLFEYQLNSNSCTLSETIGKWALLMWGVRTLWETIITDKTTKLKIYMPTWPSVAWLQQHQNGTMCHFFWNGIKEKKYDSSTLVYICLHSSTFVYTRLVNRLHSSTFVYIRLWLVCICLHSSTLV